MGLSPCSDAIFTPGFTPLESEFNLMVDWSMKWKLPQLSKSVDAVVGWVNITPRVALVDRGPG